MEVHRFTKRLWKKKQPQVPPVQIDKCWVKQLFRPGGPKPWAPRGLTPLQLGLYSEAMSGGKSGHKTCILQTYSLTQLTIWAETAVCCVSSPVIQICRISSPKLENSIYACMCRNSVSFAAWKQVGSEHLQGALIGKKALFTSSSTASMTRFLCSAQAPWPSSLWSKEH